jgi:hypothetical protein
VYGAATGIGGAQPFNLTYDYDRIGNITWAGSPTGQAGGGLPADTYTYPASGPNSVRPHAVSSTSSLGAFTYDANGSMLTRSLGWGIAQCLTWNALNQLVRTSKAQPAGPCNATDGDAYLYDTNGQRVVRRTVDGATTTTTVYLEGLGEITTTNSTGPFTGSPKTSKAVHRSRPRTCRATQRCNASDISPMDNAEAAPSPPARGPTPTTTSTQRNAVSSVKSKTPTASLTSTQDTTTPPSDDSFRSTPSSPNPRRVRIREQQPHHLQRPERA